MAQNMTKRLTVELGACMHACVRVLDSVLDSVRVLDRHLPSWAPLVQSLVQLHGAGGMHRLVKCHWVRMPDTTGLHGQ